MTFIYILIALGIVIMFTIASYYNKFIKNKNKVTEAWSSIEIQLKRRYNLIPNLLNTVKAVAKHEEEIFENISRSRQEGIEAQGVEHQAQAERKLNNSIHQLFGIAQKYPELQANKNFLDFQDTMEEIEKQIQLSRRYYNAVVRDSNTAVETFPGVLFANMFGFGRFDFFEIDNYQETKNPKVKFD